MATLSSIVVPTPWYPAPHNRMGGSFVSDWSVLSRTLAEAVRVVHAEEWPGGPAEVVRERESSASTVLGHLARTGGLTVTGRFGPLTRVPTVITSGFSVADRAEAAVEASRRYGGSFDAPVLHGHVGYLGGLTAARLAPETSRVVVTEHSTGLEDFLGTARGREIYAEVLDRAHALTTVSSVVRDLVLDVFPQHAATVQVVPNPVDFTPRRQRSSTPERLDRWVFAGGLIERKGVLVLARAFAAVAASRRSTTLDLFGSGPLEDQIRDIAKQAGVLDRLTIHGSVPRARLLDALPDYDLLLAPSTFETFHLVVPEAVAAGVPVIVTRSGGPEEALAGVEDLVGRFVDVSEDPDQIVDAVRDLDANLADLDLAGARERLAARYGPAAVTGELARLYGVSSPVFSPTHGPEQRAVTRGRPRRPERTITMVSVTGWRKYAVAAAVESAHEAGLKPVLVTADGQLRSLHPTLPVAPPETWTSSERRSLLDRLRPALRALRARRRPRLADVRATTRPDLSAQVLVLDVASFPTASDALTEHPELRLGVEVDRARFGLDPVDAP